MTCGLVWVTKAKVTQSVYTMNLTISKKVNIITGPEIFQGKYIQVRRNIVFVLGANKVKKRKISYKLN